MLPLILPGDWLAAAYLRSEYVLGNLLEDPTDEIWNGERMRNLRRALSQKRPQDINICEAYAVPCQGSYSRRTSLDTVGNLFLADAWRR